MLRPSREGMVDFLLATVSATVLIAMIVGTMLLGASGVSGGLWDGWRRGYVCPPAQTDQGGE